MKINKLFVSGGSHCIGGGFNWDEVIKLYQDDGYIISNRFDVTYPKLIGNHFGLDVIFEGEFGGSINKMIKKTYEYILNNDSSEILIILEVPPGWRDEFYSNDLKRFVNITIGNVLSPDDNTEVANGYDVNDLHKIHEDIKNYFTAFVDYDVEKKKWMFNLFGLISYFKLNNIKYILIDNGYFQQFLKTYKIPETDYNFLWFDNGNAMNNWINEKQLTIKVETNYKSNDEHLGIKGHKLVADKIINYINENKTLFS